MHDERLFALLDVLAARDVAPLDLAYRAEPEDPFEFLRAYAETGTPRGRVRLAFPLRRDGGPDALATLAGVVTLAWNPHLAVWEQAEARILPGPAQVRDWTLAGVRVVEGGRAALLYGIDGFVARVSVEDEEPPALEPLP